MLPGRRIRQHTSAYVCCSRIRMLPLPAASSLLPLPLPSGVTDVCSRMLTYAHVCSRMLTYAASSRLSLLLPAVCDAAAPVRDTDTPAANSLRPLPLAVRRELDTAISEVVAISGSALSADDNETYDAQNAWDKRKSVAELASRCRMLAYAYVCSRMLTYAVVCCQNMLTYAHVCISRWPSSPQISLTFAHVYTR
jgi:hypothetical protein